MKNLKDKLLNQYDLNDDPSSTTLQSIYNHKVVALKRECSYCKANRGCNNRNRFYSYVYEKEGVVRVETKYPSWKLRNKLKHQWQAEKSDVMEYKKGRHLNYASVPYKKLKRDLN